MLHTYARNITCVHCNYKYADEHKKKVLRIVTSTSHTKGLLLSGDLPTNSTTSQPSPPLPPSQPSTARAVTAPSRKNFRMILGLNSLHVLSIVLSVLWMELTTSSKAVIISFSPTPTATARHSLNVPI